jgi:transcriptional regulator with XRE-family HTH domain
VGISRRWYIKITKCILNFKRKDFVMMRINEIIKEKRLEKGYTQEQMAELLGITAPAVNKWEKGASYPDITLLSPLARLLGVDLNTLLSFHEDLSEKEVQLFVSRLSKVAEEDGFEAAYREAYEKVKEYPRSYNLMLNVGATLEGLLLLGKAESKEEKVTKWIEELYLGASKSDDSSISDQARSMLISKYRGREEYDKAQQLLDSLPDKNFVDKEQIQANLLFDQGKYEEAGKLTEGHLISGVSDIYASLIMLMELALKEGRIEDAEYIVKRYEETSKGFDMWEYGWYVARFELYTELERWDEFLEVLEKILLTLKEGWKPMKSPLYHYKEFKPEEEEQEGNRLGDMMRTMILNAIYQDEHTAFLKDDPRFLNMLKRVDEQKFEE